MKFVNIDGVKIGFISGTSYDFASLKDKWTDYDKIGCAWINSPEINKQVIENKSKCDYLFVISHGGFEYMDVPLPEWRDRYRELIDLGVDAIIGSHPHVPQGVEVYKNKPIFYSLGNFYFDILGKTKKKYWDNGLLSFIEIENGNIYYEIIPTIRKGHIIDIDHSKEMQQHLNNITQILSDDIKYMEQVNLDVLKHYPIRLQWILYAFNAVEMKLNTKNIFRIFYRLMIARNKPNLKLVMSQMREESANWLFIPALKLITKSDL